MSALWRTWVSLWDHREPPTSLALVRILVAAVLLFELTRLEQLHLVEVLFAPAADGGLADPMGRANPPWVFQLFPATAATGQAVWMVSSAAAAALLLGGASRLSALILAISYAQLAQIFPLADRAIDMLLRNALWLLALSGCGRAWSLDARLRTGRWRGDGRPVPAWPRHLLVLQLAVVYSMAGVQKLALSWWPMGGWSALYLVLQDPAVARADPAWLEGLYPLTQLASAGTMAFEWSALLLPLAYWYRATADRPGRLRRWLNRWRFRDVWVAAGVALHLGIAATMNLGIFPFGMLALYPAFFHPDELPGRSPESA